MAKGRKSKKKNEELIVDVFEAGEVAQNFFEKNQMKIIGAAGLLILLVGGFIAYKMFYQAPREKTAATQMYKAELRFMQDSFVLALESPGGNYDGLLDIIDNYNGTKAANLAKYYAGISYLNLNRFEDAITYLSNHNPSTGITTITKYGAMGDAHAELGKLDVALTNYKKAANASANDALTPYYLYKYGLLSKKQGDDSAAKSAFERIKSDFPRSQEAIEADKYLASVQ